MRVWMRSSKDSVLGTVPEKNWGIGERNNINYINEP